MNIKKTATVILSTFIVVSLIFAVSKGFRSPKSNNSGGNAESPVKVLNPKADMDIVYYFYTSKRCPSCYKIEAFTKEALDKKYKEMIDGEKLFFRMVNVEEPSNNHFVEDYSLYTKSVVLVKIRDGKQAGWKNLDEIWNLLGDSSAFISYVQKEIDDFFFEKGA